MGILHPLTIIGVLKGYGGCARCRDTWNWKKGHTIKHNDCSGMFPLCEECYWKISVNERKFYVRQLVHEWQKQWVPTQSSPPGTLNGQPWHDIIAKAYEFIDKEAVGRR